MKKSSQGWGWLRNPDVRESYWLGKKFPEFGKIPKLPAFFSLVAVL